LVARLEAAPAPPPARAARATAGDSQFEAASVALWGVPAYAHLLRQLVVAHMRESPEEYAWFLGDDFQAYLAAMAAPGTPADELTLRALADRLGTPVTLVTGAEAMWCVRYPPRRTLSQREVVLAAAGPGSFAAVRRQSTLSTLRKTLAGGEDVKQARDTRRRLMADCTAERLEAI
jgi:hypothetical protein